MNKTDLLARFSEEMDAAAREASAVSQLSNRADITLDDAYAIQKQSIALRCARGEKRIGAKLGFTSRAKAIQMGVDDIIVGQLTDAMLLENASEADFSRFVHPRAEPEIAFLLREPLRGTITPPQAINAIAGVAPALEIIDSRYRDFRFSLADVVADNCSSSAFVLGAWASLPDDLSNLGMTLEINGRTKEVGSSAAILGHPVYSLIAAARMLARYDMELEAGSIVLAGAATAAVAVDAHSHVRAVVQGLGHVSVQFQPGKKST